MSMLFDVKDKESGKDNNRKYQFQMPLIHLA